MSALESYYMRKAFVSWFVDDYIMNKRTSIICVIIIKVQI